MQPQSNPTFEFTAAPDNRLTFTQQTSSVTLAGPVQGPAGKDSTVPGPAGYTPVKGVDYFDGTDGANGIDGTNGKNVELQKTATNIQWRYVGDTTWNDLVALSAITGPAGTTDYTVLSNKPDLSVYATTSALTTGLGERIYKDGDIMTGALGMGTNQIYNLADGTSPDHAVNKGQLTTGLASKSDVGHSHAQSDVTGLSTALSGKQDTLVSGTTIKTINSQSLLGSGDIVIAGGSGGVNITNLAATLSASNTIITSDTGTDATIPAVDSTNAGVMTPTMKTALDNAGKARTFVTVTRNSSTHPADYTCDGTADDVEIQTAIDSLGSRGGVVFIRSSASAYRIAATITLPGNVWLVGEKQTKSNANGGVVFQTAASTSLSALVSMTGTSSSLKVDGRIENIVLNGNNTTTTAVSLMDVDTIKIIDCRIIQCTNALVSDWDGTSAPSGAQAPGGIWIQRCNISALTTGYGITLNYNTQVWISDCWFTAGATNPVAWLKIKSSNKVKVTNCEFNTTTTACIELNDVNDGSGLALGCHNIIVTSSVFATGNVVLDDNRTHASSSRVYIDGTLASGSTAGDTPVGTGNSVVLDLTTTLAGKANTTHSHAQSDVTNLVSDLAGKAATVHGHTASDITDFTTAVDARVANVIDAAPATLDTLNELAAALGDDPNFATTMTTSLAGKAAAVHTHAQSDITNLSTDLADKASKSAANTFTAGMKQTMTQDATTAGMNLGAVSADPSAPANGDLWYNAASGLKYRTASATRILVARDSTDTLVNKTLTSPVINSPTGLVKADVGLGNVDNTSNATERAAAATLTNKDLTSTTNTFASVITTASSATPTPTGDARENELYVTALAATAAVAAPTGTASNGNKLIIRIKDNGTARTLSWNAIYRAIGVTLPTTTTATKTMYIAAKYNSTDSKWDVLAVGQEA